MKHFLVCVALLLLAVEASAEFVTNGTFEAGNTGFTSAYTYSPGDLVPAGVYDVVTDPARSRFNDPSTASYKDHTTGAGLMLAVNSTLEGDQSIWAQTVPVTPDSDYEFALWVSSWYGD